MEAADHEFAVAPVLAFCVSGLTVQCEGESGALQNWLKAEPCGNMQELTGTGGGSLIRRTLGWVVKEGEPLLVYPSFKNNDYS